MDKNMSILVVDDFPTMRRIIRSLLKELGFGNVDEAEDGQEALTKLRGGGFQFVVSDWNMPNLDGLEMLKQIRADSDLNHLPVLMVTARAILKVKNRSSANGGSGRISMDMTSRINTGPAMIFIGTFFTDKRPPVPSSDPIMTRSLDRRRAPPAHPAPANPVAAPETLHHCRGHS